MRRILPFDEIYGVDFSGAKLAGRTCWVARAEVGRRGVMRLVELCSLERLCGSAERGPALEFLVRRIRQSSGALWAMDFPFGVPVELMGGRMSWRSVLKKAADFGGDGHEFGVWWLRRAQALGGANHLRRETDDLLRAPFSCYHYRIAYQTLHGMRDVLRPLSRDAGTAVLPFQHGRLASARRVVVEACPSSTLQRLGLPHHNYKQPAGGPLTYKRRRNRWRILEGLSRRVQMSEAHRLVIMRDGGGDAMDAVIAAVGGIDSWTALDHAGIAANRRWRREGYLYA